MMELRKSTAGPWNPRWLVVRTDYGFYLFYRLFYLVFHLFPSCLSSLLCDTLLCSAFTRIVSRPRIDVFALPLGLTALTRGPRLCGITLNHGHCSPGLRYFPLRPLLRHRLPYLFHEIRRTCCPTSYLNLLEHARDAHRRPLDHTIFPPRTLPICIHEPMATR